MGRVRDDTTLNLFFHFADELSEECRKKEADVSRAGGLLPRLTPHLIRGLLSPRSAPVCRRFCTATDALDPRTDNSPYQRVRHNQSIYYVEKGMGNRILYSRA